ILFAWFGREAPESHCQPSLTNALTCLSLLDIMGRQPLAASKAATTFQKVDPHFPETDSGVPFTRIMFEKFRRIRLLYIVLGVLLLVGLLPLAFAGISLSGRSAEELRSVEGRYQAQLVQDKARQIELYGQRYRDVVLGLARAFEIAGGTRALNDAGYDSRLQKTLEEDPNLIALAIWPVSGEVHRAFQPDLIQLSEVQQRVGEVLQKMSGRGIVVSRPQIIRSGQEMA